MSKIGDSDSQVKLASRGLFQGTNACMAPNLGLAASQISEPSTVPSQSLGFGREKIKHGVVVRSTGVVHLSDDPRRREGTLEWAETSGLRPQDSHLCTDNG